MKLSIQEKNRLKGKYGEWALVTGASSGIGLEIGSQLADAGLNLILNARNENRLKEIKTALEARHGVQVKVVAADLGQRDGIDQLLRETAGLNIGLLAASAGFGTSGQFVQSALEDEIQMLRLNCEALLILTHHFGQQFVVQQRGGIILMSSMVAFQGVPYAAHYAATKAYVQSLAEALALELKPYKVDVLAAAPGPVDSGFSPRADMKNGMALKPADVGIPTLRALGRRNTVLPGGLTKFLVYSLRTLPRWGKVRVMKMVMGGMTAHQRLES